MPTDLEPQDDWLDDDPEAGRQQLRAAIVLALALDRARKRMGKRTMGRLRAKLRRRKPKSKGE